VFEPGVDHPPFRGERELIGRELFEPPRAIFVGAGADLEDQRLAALARERGEVVVKVRHELEVDEHLDRRLLSPHLRRSDHPRGQHALATGPVHGEHRVHERCLALVADPEQR